MQVIVIEQKQILKQFHKGLIDAEINIICNLLKQGNCIYLECDSSDFVKNWFIYDKYKSDGQLISGTNYETFKKNKFNVE